MSASESTDCYLCGARNDVEADTCVRCDGQLLKLPADTIDIAEIAQEELIVDEVHDVVEDAVRKPASRRRSGSAEDQRLSDALGLTDRSETVDPDFIEAVVTSVPRAQQSANIPLIGTRTGMVPQAAMHAKEFGIRTYVLLALLVVMTGWFGWATLSKAEEDPQPDNLAFTNSTLPPRTTTTTEVTRREWTEAEVEGRYGVAFTRVQLYSCPTETPTGGLNNIEADDDMWSSGIAVDDHNVILTTDDLRSANAAVVRTRNGSQRLAIVQTGPQGTRLATTASPISRSLELGSQADGEPTYFLSYDSQTNVVTSASAAQTTTLEVTVSNLGDVLEARLGRARLDAAELAAINHRVEPVEDEDAPEPVTICDRANRLTSATPSPSNEPNEAN